MLNTIKIKIDKEHNLERDSYTIARSNENDVVQMEITLDESLSDGWLFIDFIKPDETKYKTSKLNIEDNVATYKLPSGLIDLVGILKVQIVLQNEEGQIWKSDIKEFGIEKSINATDDIQEKDDFITNAQNLLNEIENGLTPTIGENDNWFILGVDTGKTSRGATGESGKDGYTPVKGTDYFDGKNGKDGNDYVITNEDYEEIGSIVEENIQPILDEIKATSEQAESIARGKSQAIVFETFEELEAWLKDSSNKGIGLIGDNLYIKQMWVDEEKTIRQPDYWITEVLEKPNELGYYYEISDLGVEHPDLTNYVKDTDYATSSKGGVVRINASYGVNRNTVNHSLYIISATNAEIDAKSNVYKPIVPSNLEYAVKSALNSGIFTYDEETETLSINI